MCKLKLTLPTPCRYQQLWFELRSALVLSGWGGDALPWMGTEALVLYTTGTRKVVPVEALKRVGANHANEFFCFNIQLDIFKNSWAPITEIKITDFYDRIFAQ